MLQRLLFMFYSWNRWRRVNRLSLKFSQGSQKAENEFLDFCTKDRLVARAMSDLRLNKDDIQNIVWMLMANGAGQWVNGHYVALSAIADVNCLHKVVVQSRSGRPWQQIALICLENFD